LLRKSPDALLIIAIVLLLFTALTWLVPAGTYERVVKNGKTTVVADTYAPIERNGQGAGDLLTAPLKGFMGAAEIIGFVLLVGGAFSMLNATGAIEAGLRALVRYADQNPGARKLVVPLLMALFSLAGCTFGMSEENLVFILITIPLARKLGYDAIVGVAIPFVGAAAGFAGAAINPFTLGIAQGLAELPIGSGAGYRWSVWAIFTAVAILFVMRYIRWLERNPGGSILAKDAYHQEDTLAIEAEPESIFGARHVVVLVVFGLAIALLMYGSSSLGWFIGEIAALFIALGVVAALVGGLSASQAIKAFKEGAAEMLTAALIIALSRSVLVVAEDGHIIDTLLYGMSGMVAHLPEALSVQAMFLTQGLINVFIPSGSGQAAITMPIMIPLADLLNISRQTAVLAFQFGDGIFNLIIPTSGVTMGVLAVGKIPFGVWLRWVWKLVLWLVIFAAFFLALPSYVQVWP
jgi:uncharacterized ion transporter superfamily protein YfcC